MKCALHSPFLFFIFIHERLSSSVASVCGRGLTTEGTERRDAFCGRWGWVFWVHGRDAPATFLFCGDALPHGRATAPFFGR
jgi:hypothetical protein